MGERKSNINIRIQRGSALRGFDSSHIWLPIIIRKSAKMASYEVHCVQVSLYSGTSWFLPYQCQCSASLSIIIRYHVHPFPLVFPRWPPPRSDLKRNPGSHMDMIRSAIVEEDKDDPERLLFGSLNRKNNQETGILLIYSLDSPSGI